MVVKKLKELLDKYDDVDVVIFNKDGINLKRFSDDKKHWFNNLDNTEKNDYHNKRGYFKDL